MKQLMHLLRSENGSFTVDCFLLIPLVAVSQSFLMSKCFFKYFDAKKVLVWMTTLFLGTFLSVAVMLYLDIIDFSFLAPISGNDFMWNWPVLQVCGERIVSADLIPTYLKSPDLNLLAWVFFLVIYPAQYYLFVQAGYLLFGRSPRQSGSLKLFFPRELDLSKENFN